MSGAGGGVASGMVMTATSYATLSIARGVLALAVIPFVATRARRESVTREDNMADLVAAYDFLAAHPQVDRGAMGVVGSSYGGYLATLLTGLRPVNWLALRAPALYKDSDWHLPKQQLSHRQDLASYRQQRIPAAENRALAACAASAASRRAARATLLCAAASFFACSASARACSAACE